MQTVPISSLERLQDTTNKQLKGVVTLLWPYSSSTQKAAFLIAEPDFRLRYSKGQVRVQLFGPAAVAFAKSRLGIGDEIVLDLNGAKWVQAENDVSTPGRSVDLELEYGLKLNLHVQQDGVLQQRVHVDEPYDPDTRTTRNPVLSLTENARPITPIPRRLAQDTSKVSPNFHQRARLSGGSAVDSPLDPFGGDNLDLDRQRKKPRVSWSTPSRWKVVRQTPSPQKSVINREDDVFWLGSQQSQQSNSETPIPSDANSGATSPISEAELTQIVEDARQDFLSRKQAQEIADNQNGSMTFEPYRDPVPDAINTAYELDQLPHSVPTKSRNFAARADLSQPEIEDPEPVTNITITQISQEVIEISSDSSSDSSHSEPQLLPSVAPIPPLVEATLELSRSPSIAPSTPRAQEMEDLEEIVNSPTSSTMIHIRQTDSVDRPAGHHDDLNAPLPSSQAYLTSEVPQPHPAHLSDLPVPSTFVSGHVSEPVPPSIAASPSNDSFQPILAPISRVADSIFGFGFGVSRVASGLKDTDRTLTSASPEFGLDMRQSGPRAVPDNSVGTSSLGVLDPFFTGPNDALPSVIEPTTSASIIDVGEFPAISQQPMHMHATPVADVMTHVSDSMRTNQDTSFERSSTIVHEGQGQPTGSFATSTTPDRSFSLAASVIQATNVISDNTAGLELHSTSQEVELSRDHINAILEQSQPHAPDNLSQAMDPWDFANEDVNEKQALPNLSPFLSPLQATTGASDQPTDMPSTSAEADAIVTHFRHAELDEQAGKSEQVNPISQDVPTAEHESLQSRETVQNQSALQESYSTGVSPTRQSAVAVSVSAENASSTPIEAPSSSLPIYPDLTQQVRAIQESDVDDSQITAIEDSVPEDAVRNTIDVSSSRSHTIQRPSELENHQDMPARSPAVLRTSSAVDIMAFFGASSQASRITPRLSAQTTAIPSDLTAIEHQLDQLAQSSQIGASPSDIKRRVSRRPGEVRKVLKMPETALPSGELGSRSSQHIATQSTADGEMSQQKILGAPRRSTRASSRRSQSLLTDLHETTDIVRHQMEALQDSPTRQITSQSPIMESIEIGEHSMSQPSIPDALRSPSKPHTSVELMSTLISTTQDDRFTQSKVEDGNSTRHSGLRTLYSYYVPLINLPAYLNKDSAYDSIIDVLAVVYRATSAPAKAEKARKDWYTKMRVTQPGFWRNTTLVQVFRGYKEAVPQAEAGDVILLRSFQVTGNKKGGVALKSVDGSAWCVFKADAKARGKMKLTAVEAEDSGKAEIMTGPPAEFGDQERHAAEELKRWWMDSKAAADNGTDRDKSHL